MHVREPRAESRTVLASHEDGVGRLVLARPPLNILTRSMLAELREALRDLGAVRDLRVVVLEAEGKHFSAGADVEEHLPPEHEALIPEFVDTVRALHGFPLPTVAAVRGRCLGGGFELVQAADLVVAGAGASFGQPEIVLGVMAPAACALLPERAPAAARELLFTGDAVDAEAALRMGLVTRVVDDGEVERAAHEMAGRVARHSGAALRTVKSALLAGRGRGVAEALDSAARIYLEELMATEDAVAGLRAFVEKRTPVWRHR